MGETINRREITNTKLFMASSSKRQRNTPLFYPSFGYPK